MKLPASLNFLRWCLAIFGLSLMTACGGSDSSSSPQLLAEAGAVTDNGVLLSSAFGAELSGSQETPANPSTAKAAGAVLIDPVTRNMKGVIITAGIAGTMAHIHEAPAGTAGPIVFPFTETAPGSGIWTAQAVLTEAQVNTFKAGNYYFNVHSAAFPQGELRGQAMALRETASSRLTSQTGNAAAAGADSMTAPGASTAAQRFNTFIDVLSGAQVRPSVSSQGSGIGLAITDSQSASLVTAIVTQGINGTAANIQNGVSGVNGATVFALNQSAPASGIWTLRQPAPAAAGTPPATSPATTPPAGPLTADQLNAFNSGAYYFNVQSAAFGNGELRGQILPSTTGGALTPSTQGGATPATPASPATPAAPGSPGTPGTPATPATPAMPAMPATPANPAAPTTPTTPTAPSSTTTPPAGAGTPGTGVGGTTPTAGTGASGATPLATQPTVPNPLSVTPVLPASATPTGTALMAY